jgi:hypothetical protein
MVQIVQHQMVGQLQTETDVEATSHGLISDTILAICLE